MKPRDNLLAYDVVKVTLLCTGKGNVFGSFRKRVAKLVMSFESVGAVRLLNYEIFHLDPKGIDEMFIGSHAHGFVPISVSDRAKLRGVRVYNKSVVGKVFLENVWWGGWRGY
jgi:hypothetical protein